MTNKLLICEVCREKHKEFKTPNDTAGRAIMKQHLLTEHKIDIRFLARLLTTVE